LASFFLPAEALFKDDGEKRNLPMSKQSGKPVRLMIAAVFIIAGALISDLNVSGFWKPLILNLGLSFIVAGVVSFFHTAILRMESEESGEVIADCVQERLHRHLPLTRGIRIVSNVRKGNDAYYAWVNASDNPDLFFAGRSVLHRIDFDIRRRSRISAEKAIANRLRAGATIRILFLDPRSVMIDRLAEESGQGRDAMLSDMAYSLGICRRLYEDHLKHHHFSSHAHLEIRVYDEIPYFAYHKQNDKVFVGFYFTTALGQDSPAFEVLDPETQKLFADHFATVFGNGFRLLELIPHRKEPYLDEKLMDEMTEVFVRELGEEQVSRLMGFPSSVLHAGTSSENNQ
jgi:hypothetical protein